MYLFEELKFIENLGYKILTYEEAEKNLKIEPKQFGDKYIFLKLHNKKFFIINEISNEINILLETFCKNHKQDFKVKIYKFEKDKKEATL